MSPEGHLTLQDFQGNSLSATLRPCWPMEGSSLESLHLQNRPSLHFYPLLFWHHEKHRINYSPQRKIYIYNFPLCTKYISFYCISCSTWFTSTHESVNHKYFPLLSNTLWKYKKYYIESIFNKCIIVKLYPYIFH